MYEVNSMAKRTSAPQVKSVLAVKEYGTVKLKLKQALQRAGMNRNQLAVLVNANFSVIDKWYRGEVERLDLDILARICYVLDCEIGESLEYRP